MVLIYFFIQEKYNVWAAYLNMEYKYGTKDTLEAVFKRAVQESKVRSYLIRILYIFDPWMGISYIPFVIIDALNAI